MLKVKTKNKEILENIRKAFNKKVYERLKSAGEAIKSDIKSFNIKLWQSSETYDSLLNGVLNHELGFPKGSARSRVDNILDMVGNSIRYLPKLPTNKSGKQTPLQINVFFKKISDEIFSHPDANIETGKTAFNDLSSDFGAFGAETKQTTLPWLRWLLESGNSYLVFNYKYVDISSPRSRSGKGLMIFDESEDWKVPTKYSGTRNSNWLTRTLLQNASRINKEYARIIQKHLRRL